MVWHVYADDLCELPARKAGIARKGRKGDMHATNWRTYGPWAGLDATWTTRTYMVEAESHGVGR